MGDLFGKLTSYQYNGLALNDYLLTSLNFQHKVSKFFVGDYTPWLSDHCPIYTKINLNFLEKKGNFNETLTDLDSTYKFDTTSKHSYSRGLRSEENTLAFENKFIITTYLPRKWEQN